MIFLFKNVTFFVFIVTKVNNKYVPIKRKKTIIFLYTGTNVGCGGGNSYIGNLLLTEKSMYCYNCNESSEESTKTMRQRV